MRIHTDNPWCSSPLHSGLVSLGQHSLWASVSGPVRTRSCPLLIFITGAGASSAVYVKLQHALSAHARVLFYDRAGYDQSTISPVSALPNGKIYAMDTARDLMKLLRATQLQPPYVLISHSFGGIIARSFLELNKDEAHTVTGMVLIDTATELMLQFFARVPDENLMAVARNVDWEELTQLKKQSGMSDSEWNYAMQAQARTVAALKLEDTHASAHELGLKRQLDFQTLAHRPLLILKYNIAMDYQLLYDEGVKLGGGTETEREKARSFIQLVKTYQGQISRAQCSLSKSTVFMADEDVGHDTPIRNPVMVVEKVRKFLKWLREAQGTKVEHGTCFGI
jgi:pimeloyl-ACP methyl ester carboxylesterase